MVVLCMESDSSLTCNFSGVTPVPERRDRSKPYRVPCTVVDKVGSGGGEREQALKKLTRSSDSAPAKGGRGHFWFKPDLGKSFLAPDLPRSGKCAVACDISKMKEQEWGNNRETVRNRILGHCNRGRCVSTTSKGRIVGKKLLHQAKKKKKAQIVKAALGNGRGPQAPYVMKGKNSGC